MAASSVISLILRGEDQGASSALDTVTQKVGGMGSVLQGAAGFALGGLITSGINAVTSSMSGLFSEMIGGNAAFEQYETQFTVMLGSAELAKERIADLAAFGASTPFELPGVVEADKIIQGFGLHSEESALKFGFSGEQIRTIAGDVASGTGSSFQEMSLLIGKFSAGATGEAISRMQELGITTRDELTGMGLEFSKSGQLLSPLPESMAVVLGVMEEKYGGMMAAQSTTFSGMMSNLEDWKAGTIRTIGAPIFEVLKEKLSGVLTFLGSPEVQAGISTFATTLATGIGTVVDFISNKLVPGVQWLAEVFQASGFDYLFGVFEDGTSFVGGFLETLGVASEQAYATGNAIAYLVQDVKDFIDGVVAIVGPIAQSAADFVSWKDVLGAVGVVAASVVVPALFSIAAAIAPVILAGAALVGGIALVRTAWEQDWGGIQEKTQAVIDFVVPLVNGAIEGIQTWWAANGDEVVRKADEVWTNVQTGISTALTFIQTTITTIATGIQVFWDAHGLAITTAATTAWTNIQTGVSTAITFIQTTITTIATGIQTFWAAHGVAITTAATTAWTAIQTGISTAITGVQTTITTIATGIQTFWNAHGQTILLVAQTAWDGIKLVVETVTTLISGIVSVWSAALEGDWYAFGENLRSLTDTFSSTITLAWVNFGLELQTLATTAWDAIGNVFSTAKLNITTTFNGMVTDIIATFTNTDWGSVGSGIINGIAAGISGGIEAITSAATSAAAAALDAAKGYLGIQSPSTVAAAQIGKPFNEGVAKGITDNLAPIEQSIGGVVDLVRKGGDSLKNGGIGFVGGISNPILTGGKDTNAMGFMEAMYGNIFPDEGPTQGGIFPTVPNGPVQGGIFPINPTPPTLLPIVSTPSRVEHHYTVTINDERSMLLFLDYLRSISDTNALEAIN